MRFFRKKSDGYRKETKQILEHLQCECSVFPKNSKLTEIQEAYRKARKLGKSEGFTPLLIVPSETLLEIIKCKDEVEGMSISSIQDGRKILANLWEKGTDELIEDSLFMTDAESFPEETINEVLSFKSRTGRLEEEVILAKIPTKHPWEIFASLPFGGWNTCPSTTEIMAVSKYWYESFGAVPAVMAYDTVEYYLDNPIQAREEANQLAKEHYAFCEECIWHGTDSGTIVELANLIKNSSVWHFWWD